MQEVQEQREEEEKAYREEVERRYKQAEEYRIERLKNELKEQSEHPEKVLVYMGVPFGYTYKRFENYEGLTEIKKSCLALAESEESGLLIGGTGTGKTHLAVAILRRKIELSKKVYFNTHFRNSCSTDPLFVSCPELLLEVRATYQKNSEVFETDIINKYRSTSLLILDDMGAERGTQWTESTLYLIIDYRDKNNLQTIITSNLSLEEIEQIHGARIASRLSNAKLINIKAADYRKRRFKGVRP